MNLYKLTLKNYKDYYVAEEDPTKAQEKLIKYLNKKNIKPKKEIVRSHYET